jgi:hypothetical protein
MSDRPLLTVDMDGVICRPILVQNPGIHLTFLDATAAPPPARVYPHWLNAPLDHLRFDLRRPQPGAREAVRALAEVRRLVLLTGRRTRPHAWLRRHGFAGLFEDVIVNATDLRSPHYKLEAIRSLGADEHVDDDPRTAQLLAQASQARVFLCDWPRSSALVMDPRVTRVRDIADLARRITAAVDRGPTEE